MKFKTNGTYVSHGNGSKLHQDKLARQDKIARRKFCTADYFCTRVKKIIYIYKQKNSLRDKLIKNYKNKKNTDRPMVRGNSDSKSKKKK